MSRKRFSSGKGSGWTFDKKLFLCLVVAVSFLSVWIAVSDKRISLKFKDIVNVVAENRSFQEHITTRKTPTIYPTLQPQVVPVYNTNVNNNNKDVVTNFTAVLLLTYMRSGSSVTGEILQQSEDVFYVFEPFRMLQYLTRTTKSIQWFNRTVSSVDRVNITDVKRRTLIGWLTCDFSMIYAQMFDDWHFLSFGKKTTIYNDCIAKYYGSEIYNVNRTSPRKYPYIRLRAFYRGSGEKCIQDLQNACLASKVRIVKTIRTKMSLASDIMETIEELKVINLIRDPRTTVVSQYRYQGCPGNESTLFTCAYWHCGNVLSDIIVKLNLVVRRPGRILTVLYEHITSFPGEMTEIMYKFLGIDFTDILKSYARKLVQGDNSTDCKVCQQSWQNRSSSNLPSDREALFEKYGKFVIIQIQNICSDVIDYYGYEVYNVGLVI